MWMRASTHTSQVEIDAYFIPQIRHQENLTRDKSKEEKKRYNTEPATTRLETRRSLAANPQCYLSPLARRVTHLLIAMFALCV